MAKISDEIRKWADDLDSDDIVCTTATLYTLADRIDSEMVELPKDADGEPIHVGDTAYLKDGREVKVRLPFELWHERPDSWERIAQDMEDWSDDNRVNWISDVSDRAAEFAHRIRKLAKKEDQR